MSSSRSRIGDFGFFVYFNFPHKKVIVPYIREILSEIEKQANWMCTGATTYCAVVVRRWPWSSLPASTLLLVSICPCAENRIYTAHQRDVVSVGRNLVVFVYNMYSSGKMNRLCLCLWYNQSLIKLFCELNENENCKANWRSIKSNMIITKADYRSNE